MAPRRRAASPTSSDDSDWVDGYAGEADIPADHPDPQLAHPYRYRRCYLHREDYKRVKEMSNFDRESLLADRRNEITDISLLRDPPRLRDRGPVKAVMSQPSEGDDDVAGGGDDERPATPEQRSNEGAVASEQQMGGEAEEETPETREAVEARIDQLIERTLARWKQESFVNL